MVTFVGAPWKAVENALEKVMELEKMLQSKELKDLTKKMENNFPLQNSSTTNIDSFLENNGVKVPQGITFSIAARKSNAHRANFRVTIDVPVPQPSGSSKK